MKILFNREPVNGPWGGGNKTLSGLIKALEDKNHKIVHKLEENIDLIFCFDPRPDKYGQTYDHFLNYREKTGAKIFQRVGDVGTHGKPHLTKLVKKTTQLSDYLFFPSLWAKEYINYDKDNFSIISNAPLDVFYTYRKDKSIEKKIKVVTHHWSTNPKKGFEYYKFLDNMFSQNVEFTFIGRLPEGFKFNNCYHMPPTGDNEKISRTLANNDIYLTASEEEAGANHVLEALAAGLPVVYHNNGGSINEYCEDYGLEFSDEKSMAHSLVKVAKKYQEYKSRVMRYDNSLEKTIEKYLEIIF